MSQETYCRSCQGTYSPEKDVWTSKSNLTPSDFDPFIVEKYGCGCKSGNYTARGNIWTKGCNITPDNSAISHTKVIKCQIYDNSKEGFEYTRHGTYSKLCQTWGEQY